ncbi:MAG: hypothetical protein OHK0029_18880 [Armatimonadaceae bacterium]
MFSPKASHSASFFTPSRNRFAAWNVFLLAAFLAGTASAVRADLKIQANVITNGKKESTTTYYKGSMMRSEEGSNVIIFDGSKNIAYSLNTANKTYQVINFGEMTKNPAFQMMDIKSNVSLKPGGKTKTILGKPAKNYVYSATVKFTMKPEAMERIKAQSGGNATPNLEAMMPTVTITGETWVTEALSMPSGGAAGAMATLQNVPGVSDLMKKFKTIKGVPLESTQTVKVAGGMGAANQRNVTTKTIATAISQASLPSSLFEVPKGYTKQQQPTRPAGAPGGVRPKN